MSSVVAVRCMWLTSRSGTVQAALAYCTAVVDSMPGYEDGRPFKEIPGPRGWPLIGSLLDYRIGPYSPETYHKALYARYREFGKVFRENIGGDSLVHIMDPEYIQAVYKQEDKTPMNAPLLETSAQYRSKKGMSMGLGFTNGEEWYRLRMAVNKAMMRPKSATEYLPLTREVTKDFITRLKKILSADGQIPDFRNEISKWALESSGMMAFETRLGCFECGLDSYQQKMIDSNQITFQLSTKLYFSLPIFKHMSCPTREKLLEAEDYFFGPMFQTAPTVTGILYCLACNASVQETLHKEIMEHIPQSGEITPATLDKLVYLKACIKEGFRFFPVGVKLSRIAKKNLLIGGYQIPAGTHMNLDTNVLLQSEEYFTEPERFLPERWLRGNQSETVNPFMLSPFGKGIRTCAGRRFAEQDMQMLIATILQSLRLEWPHAERMGQTFQMLLTPDREADFKWTTRDPT